jgi:hypothetical protein
MGEQVTRCRICCEPIIGEAAEELWFNPATGETGAWRLHLRCRDRLVKKLIEFGHRKMDPRRVAEGN